MNVSLGNVGNTINVGNVVNIGNRKNHGNTSNNGNHGNNGTTENNTNNINAGNIINIGNTVNIGNSANTDNKLNSENAEKITTVGTNMKNNTKKRMAFDVAQNQVERKTDDFRYMLRSTSVNNNSYYNDTTDYYSEFDVSV